MKTVLRAQGANRVASSLNQITAAERGSWPLVSMSAVDSVGKRLVIYRLDGNVKGTQDTDLMRVCDRIDTRVVFLP